MQLLYKIIYNPKVNYLIRNINKSLFTSFIKIPPSGKIKFKYDELTFFINTNQTNYITHVLFYNGCKNYEYSSIFKKLITKCDVFFDIGANTGYYSVLGCKANPKLNVTCFEPAKGSLYYLAQTIHSNNLSTQIKVEPIALAGNSGTIEFKDVTNNKYKSERYNLAGESTTSEITTGRPFEKYSVNCLTIEDYLKNKNHSRIDLIKIDTEGTEDSILKNAKTILTNDQPIIICETLFNRIESKLDDLMTEYGYEFYNHHSNGLEKVSTIKRTVDNGVNNCFFVHPSKKHLIEEFIILM
jgi:FkbM family methyltransferase